MFCDDVNAIVAHVGHLKSYIGFAGDETPMFQTDSYFYHDMSEPHSFSLLDDFSLSINYSEGIISPLLTQRKIHNTENYTHFVSQLASKINIDLRDVAVFLTTYNQDPQQEERKKLMLDFFETASCPGLFFSNKNLTCMFANGRHTGIVVDSGAYFTEITSVFQGHLLKKSSITSF